jgi:hypothetical protein
MSKNQPPIRRRPVIRVFVSSPFTDLKRERDALQQEVFQPLEQYCTTRKFQFQAIDLRWGISSEASFDHRTMQICFRELERSQEISPRPNFWSFWETGTGVSSNARRLSRTHSSLRQFRSVNVKAVLTPL